MGLSPDCVGRRFTAPAEIVDAARAAAYGAALLPSGTPDGQPAPGGPADHGPLPTFAAAFLLQPVVWQLFQDDSVGLDLPRLVHGEQSFTCHRPVRFGERLHPEGVITAVETRRQLDLLTFTVTARDDDGGAVISGTTLFIIRPRPAGG